jgi:hypothetical protein
VKGPLGKPVHPHRINNLGRWPIELPIPAGAMIAPDGSHTIFSSPCRNFLQIASKDPVIYNQAIDFPSLFSGGT